MSVKVHHREHTHFQEQILKLLVIQNNALFQIAEELKNLRGEGTHGGHP